MNVDILHREGMVLLSSSSGETLKVTIPEFWEICRIGQRLDVRDEIENYLDNGGDFEGIAADTVRANAAFMDEVVEQVISDRTKDESGDQIYEAICYCVKYGKTADTLLVPDDAETHNGGMETDPNLISLKEVLSAFDEEGWEGSCTVGDWKIAKGGYDLWFELYYKDAAVARCVDGELSSKFGLDPSQKKELFDRILETYDHLRIDPEERKEMLIASFEAGQTFYEVDTGRFISLVGESSSDIWTFDVFDSNKNPLYQTSAYAGRLADDILSGYIVTAPEPQQAVKSSLAAKIQNAAHTAESQSSNKSSAISPDIHR